LNDIKKMAAYWKCYYNTPLGRGKESEVVDNWKRYSGAKQ